MSEENLDYMKNEESTVEIERAYPLCVISVKTFGNYARHDIQTNSTWSANPYEDYVIVPDNMVADIMATKGYCDIILNDEGTEVLLFTAREIPDIPAEPEEEPEEEDVWSELDKAYQEGVDSV